MWLCCNGKLDGWYGTLFCGKEWDIVYALMGCEPKIIMNACWMLNNMYMMITQWVINEDISILIYT
jgi:hypothetical protein